jgi:excinuclease ABC subunit A
LATINLDVIKTARLDRGPGPRAGPDGGRVVAMGPPEHVATIPESLTGRYLARMLGTPA